MRAVRSWGLVFRFANDAIHAVVKAKMQHPRFFWKTEFVEFEALKAVQTGANGEASRRATIVKI